MLITGGTRLKSRRPMTCPTSDDLPNGDAGELDSPIDDYRRELKALKAIINITFNSITSNSGESRSPNTSSG